MKHRSGITLVEVLVAIFIMGIGLVALLTLFPIGVLRMAQANRDERAAQAAINAHAISIIHNVRGDAKVITEPASPAGSIDSPPAPYAVSLPVKDFFRNPTGWAFSAAAVPVWPGDADDYGPSYPVLVDAHGYHAASGMGFRQRDWVGAASPKDYPGGCLCRRTTNLAYNSPLNIARWFSLLDDISFYNQEPITGQFPGTPKQIAGGAFTRETRFTWSYLLRRPSTGDPTIVDCTIIVYDNRPMLVLGETVYSSTTVGVDTTTSSMPLPQTKQVFFSLNSNTINVKFDPATEIAPNIRPGNWIYDATAVAASKDVQSCFYRVVGVDPVSADTIRFEVQQPIRGLRSSPNANYNGTIIVMDGILEVFEKGVIRLP